MSATVVQQEKQVVAIIHCRKKTWCICSCRASVLVSTVCVRVCVRVWVHACVLCVGTYTRAGTDGELTPGSPSVLFDSVEKLWRTV